MLTNGSRRWTYRVLEHTGLDPYFDDKHIVCLEDVEFNLKSVSVEPYRLALEKVGADPRKSIMVDDSVSNLIRAKELGMTTALIIRDNQFAPHPAVDYMVKDLKEFLYAAPGGSPLPRDRLNPDLYRHQRDQIVPSI